MRMRIDRATPEETKAMLEDHERECRAEAWADSRKHIKCKCNNPDRLMCHECEESDGVCYCKCHA